MSLMFRPLYLNKDRDNIDPPFRHLFDGNFFVPPEFGVKSVGVHNISVYFIFL